VTKQIQNRTFSIVKALGIILIVIGHSAIHTQLRTFVYLINIAVFFFVAGYFFNDEYLNNPILFFRKKINRYYIPWVIYGLIFVLLHNTFLNFQLIAYNYHLKAVIEPYTIDDILQKSISVLTFINWKEPLLAPLWFLLGMFSGLTVFYSISWFAKKIGKNKFETLRASLIVFFMIVGFLGDTYKLPISIIYRPFVISGLIYIGKLYSIYANKIKLSPIIAILCFIELLIATFFDYQINIGGMIFGNPVIFLIISCSGSYMILTTAHFINEYNGLLSKSLNYIGEYSFSIMALHYISFKLVSLLQIWIYNYPPKYLAYYPVIPKNTLYWWVIYTIVGVAVPLLLASLSSKIKHDIFVKSNLKKN